MACGHVSSLDVRWAGRNCLPLYFELLHWPNALKALLQVVCTSQMGVAAGPCQQTALGFLWSHRNRRCSECSLQTLAVSWVPVMALVPCGIGTTRGLWRAARSFYPA